MTQWKMVFTPVRIAIFAVTILYTTGFYVSYVIRGNSEFVFYLLQLFGFIALSCFLLSRAPAFPNYLLALLSVIGLLHVMGGGVLLDGVRLYEVRLLDLYQHPLHPELALLKYDQFVHAFGYGVAALSFRWLLRAFGPEFSGWAQNAIAILAATGLGVLNEVSEFLATLLFARTGVGGYFNIGLDLVVNLVGALLAVGIAEFLKRLKRREK